MNSFAVVPAAGRSARMGCSKLTLPWRGTTLLEFVMQQWLQSDVTHVVVVVRPKDRGAFPRVVDHRVEVVMPAVSPPEMKDSVWCALEHIQRRYAPLADDVWLLAPADLPRLDSRLVNDLLRAHRPADSSILIPVADGRRGHPVLFPWTLAEQVALLPANVGVNALLERFPTRELKVESSGSFDDLDSPDDYRRLLDQQPPAQG